MMRRLAALALAALCSGVAGAYELPALCSEAAIAAATPKDDVATAPLSELRARTEKLIESDPNAALALMCATIPRVARQHGEDSVEMAWWVGSLATPLIAFMDRMADAIPLLEFARPILERRLGPYAAEVAEIHVAYAWIATRQGRNADAVAAWQSALRIRERNPGPRKLELQKILVGLAQTQSVLRQFDAAKNGLARAQAILRENNETVSEAAAAIENTYINIAWREEDFAAVRAHAEEQIRIEEQMASPVAQRVPAYIWLGQSLERLDEFEQAEAALRKAVAIAESKEGAPLQRHHFTALAQLAGLLVLRGKPAEGLDFAQRSIKVGEATRGPDAPMLVRPLQYAAEAQRALGDLPESLHTYERAASLVERFPNDIERPWIVAHYRGLARLQLELGERSQARAALGSASKAAGTDPTLTVERATTLRALGSLSSGPDAAAGRAALDEALALYRTRLPDTHPAILRTIAESCALELRAGGSDIATCRDAAARMEAAQGADPLLRHDVYAAWSELSLRTGDSQGAYDLAIRALSSATTLGTPDPLWRADFALARLIEARGDNPPLAIFLGKEAIMQVEALRSRFVGEDRRLEHGFLENKVDLYRTVADWLMEAGRIEEGLDVLRLLKAEELYQFALRDAQWSRTNGPIELTGEEVALRERYRALLQTDAAAGDEIDQLGRLQESGRLSISERQRLETLLATHRQLEAARAQRLRQFLDERASAPAVGTARAIKVDRLARELQSIGPDAALAYYLLTDTRLRVLIATRRGQFEYESQVEAGLLKRDIGRFLEAIARREDVSAAAQSLYAAVARPLDLEAQRAGAKRLVLWLDGALRYVPFAALNDGRRYLVDRYSIESYVPSPDSTTPSLAAAASALQRLSVRGFGLTRAVGGFDALPAMADELCDVVRGPIEGLAARGQTCPRDQVGGGALNGDGFADAAFTAAKFRTSLGEHRDFSVLHLGTHFSLRPGNARRSFLVLGDGSQLTLDAIGELDFSGLQLVTLSACQSALGGATTDDGREVEGLSAIVQRRGAQHVIASLWRVEDRSTAQLMREMYASLAKAGADAAGSLRSSQLKIRNMRRGLSQPYQHPYYWAGFLTSASQQH
ncbi:MAG TPA: CHAT domain-containing protein [Steroidobacteraceae bacterium]|nr:CHAT domain-containing protein [Steroidobacteraceae bacterium]